MNRPTHSFGRHVRLCRRARGLTQEELAESCGLSADTIRRLEQGSFSPSLDTLRKLCMGLDLRLSTLFDGFELGERDARREFSDAIDFLTEDEQRMLFQFLALLRGRLSRGNE